MAEPATKRSMQKDDDDVNSWLPWKPTGTSKAFWDLRAQRKYKEAVALLEERAAHDDAEACYELVHLADDGVLGQTRGSPRDRDLRQKCHVLHHPAVVALNLEVTSPEASPQLRYIAESGDLVAQWRIAAKSSLYNETLGNWAGLLRQTLPLRNPYMLFYAAVYDVVGYEHAACMGHVDACSTYASYWLNHRTGDPDLALHFLRIGAEQGHRQCMRMLVALLLKSGLPVHWREAAQNIVRISCLQERRKLWQDRVFVTLPRTDNASEVTAERLRELYVYATHKAEWDLTRERIASLENVGAVLTRAAKRATLTLFGILYRRKHCPRDIALLLCKDVWDSVSTRTIAWWTPVIDCMARSAGYTTGYDYVYDWKLPQAFEGDKPILDSGFVHAGEDGAKRPRRGPAPSSAARHPQSALSRLPDNNTL